MPTASSYLWLEVEPVGDATVVRFRIPWILKEGTIESIGETLSNLVETSGCQKYVVSLHNVRSMASNMFGNLVALQKKIEASGGRLVLCSVDPGLYEVFEILKLTPVMTICGSEQEALQSF